MILKKRNLLVTIFIVVVIQLLLYINNNQKNSFRYFIWNIQEVKTGKLLSISFLSGLLVSTILINSVDSKYKKGYKEIQTDGEQDLNDVENDNIYEMPPQRDIRDPQPTISVNYRVIKNTQDNNLKNKENSTKSNENRNDWINDYNDW